MQFFDAISNFFISNASAATTTTGPAPQGGGFSFLVMMGILIFFMYFAIWRPQTKRAKEQKDLLSALAKGDEVVTAGGILGTISKISDNYVVLALAENVEITMQKSSIVSALPKGTLKSI
jgi:preprotein translocase subunit YajC